MRISGVRFKTISKAVIAAVLRANKYIAHLVIQYRYIFLILKYISIKIKN